MVSGRVGFCGIMEGCGVWRWVWAPSDCGLWGVAMGVGMGVAAIRSGQMQVTVLTWYTRLWVWNLPTGRPLCHLCM
jgi:hypothetical protein